MELGTHKHTLASRLPQWLAIRAACCLFLLVTASFAGVAHKHSLGLAGVVGSASVAPQHGSHSNLPGSEETCLLCVTMHSVLLGTIFTAIATTLLTLLTEGLFQQRPIARLWHFCLFSRPPPCLL